MATMTSWQILPSMSMLTEAARRTSQQATVPKRILVKKNTKQIKMNETFDEKIQNNAMRTFDGLWEMDRSVSDGVADMIQICGAPRLLALLVDLGSTSIKISRQNDSCSCPLWVEKMYKLRVFSFENLYYIDNIEYEIPHYDEKSFMQVTSFEKYRKKKGSEDEDSKKWGGESESEIVGNGLLSESSRVVTEVRYEKYKAVQRTERMLVGGGECCVVKNVVAFISKDGDVETKVYWTRFVRKE
jgi:hypothetical protein